MREILGLADKLVFFIGGNCRVRNLLLCIGVQIWLGGRMEWGNWGWPRSWDFVWLLEHIIFWHWV